MLARGYGLEPGGAEELVDVIDQERRHAVASIRAEIAAANERSLRHWTDAGGDRRVAADDAWIARWRTALIDTSPLAGTTGPHQVD